MTNQAGIAKKKFKERDFFKLHEEINKKLKKFNIFFNDIQYSPFHPKAKIKKYMIPMINGLTTLLIIKPMAIHNLLNGLKRSSKKKDTIVMTRESTPKTIAKTWSEKL